MKDKKFIVVTVILGLIIVVLAGVLVIKTFDTKEGGTKTEQPVTEYEQQVDQITEIDKEERQKQLDQIVEDGKINIQYSLGAVFNGKVSESFNVKNIENNKHPIIFTLYDEDGEVIYESKQIEPGYEINSIELTKELSEGIHDCQIEIGYATEGNVSSVFPITIEVK